MSGNQLDSCSISLNSMSKVNGFYYLPVIKDDSVSPRFCETSPRKPGKKPTSNSKSHPSPSKISTVGDNLKLQNSLQMVNQSNNPTDEEVLAVRRLEGIHSPRPIEEPVITEPEPIPDQVIYARKFKRRPPTSTEISLLAATSGETTTEYVHHFIDEEDDNELPSSPYLIINQSLDFLEPTNISLVEGSSSLVEPSGSTLYNNTIVCDYRYILDPASSPSRQQELGSDSVLFTEDFLTYSAINITSRPNSVNNNGNGSANRSRRNSTARVLSSGNSPAKSHISINLGNIPSSVVTVEDSAAVATTTTASVAVSIPVVVPNPPVVANPHSSNYISANVVHRRNSQRRVSKS